MAGSEKKIDEDAIWRAPQGFISQFIKSGRIMDTQSSAIILMARVQGEFAHQNLLLQQEVSKQTQGACKMEQDPC